MQAHLSPSPKLRFYGRDGKPLSGGYLITYDYTTSRTCSTWADADMTTRNPFQIQLDANGEPSQNGNPVYVFLEEGRRYKFRWFDSEMNLVGSIQPVQTASVNYGDNNVFNYYASVDGTEHEITVTSSIDPETGVQTFFIGLDDDFKERVSDIEDALDDKKNKQNELTFNGSATKTVKKIVQDENGEMDVEFEDIDFPQQAPDVDVVSPNGTLDVQEEVEGNHKLIKLDVKKGNLDYYVGTLSETTIPRSTLSGSGVYNIAANLTKLDGNLDIKQTLGTGKFLFTCNISVKPETLVNEYNALWFVAQSTSSSDQNRLVAKHNIDFSIDQWTDVQLAGLINITDASKKIAFDFQVGSVPSTGVKLEVSNVTIYRIESIMSNGGGGTEYTEGEAIKIENDEISVDYGSGLEVDPLTNKLKVKIGNGLKFNEESLEVEIDSDVEDVVEAVEKLTDDLDKKITTTYPFAQITTQGDFAVFGVTNTSRMIGQLFAVPIASEIRKNETMICVNALQSFNGKVSFGIFEYDFEGNNGSGSTYWVADTGVVNVVAGENEFPLKYVDQDVHELKSSMLYYAVVAIAGDAPASGLFLAAAPNYAATYNANPKYTLLVSNMNQYIDWTTGTLQGAWFQGYNEDNTIPRLFMMLRNGEATPPIPVTEPFNDIGNFTLEHVNRVSNVFSLTPDTNGGIFRKVIPQQDVDIVSFRYVDYHGSVNQNSSTPVILDETYTPLKQVTDGSWTLGDSDQTKIDGTHYVHEFTLSTPIHLTANTPYWFLVGGNLSNQDNDWIINYQSPSVNNDLLLAKNLYNVNPYIVGNGYGEYQSSVRGMYLRLSDGTNTWVI